MDLAGGEVCGTRLSSQKTGNQRPLGPASATRRCWAVSGGTSSQVVHLRLISLRFRDDPAIPPLGRLGHKSPDGPIGAPGWVTRGEMKSW